MNEVSTMQHPRKDDNGRVVVIKKPHHASPNTNWTQPDSVAVVTPDGEVPAVLNGLPMRAWVNTPASSEEWEFLTKSQPIEEPAFDLPAGYLRAAGAVVLESDGRVWVVAPSNGFAGYQATFPKGTADAGMSLQTTALKETFEESGLQVRLIRHLIDVRRSQSYTRYYLARRVGGHPGAMGWETQAVMLVPRDQLAGVVTHPNDALILEAIDHLENHLLA